jgi:rhodanese-related sulfurtransferase
MALAMRLDQNGALLIRDVRGPDEFSGLLGHIEGAINLPLAELPDRVSDLVRDDRRVVVVCKTDRRSSIAARQLQEVVASDVSVLRGRMEQWRGLGLPVC